MNIIKNIPVDLSDIVKEANLILTVSYLKPFTEEVAIKSGDPNVPAPPFKKEGSVFTIKTVLKSPDRITLPQTISVPKENWRRSLSQHKEQYAGGPGKSYEVKQYKPEVSSMRKADILFLHHFQGTFELVVKNSFESIGALEKIMMIITGTVRPY